MNRKEEFESAIKARIDRFNKLYFKALGYTFEEEPEIERVRYEAEMAEYQPKVEARAKELGYDSEDAYLKHLWDEDVSWGERDSVMQKLWDERPKPTNELYSYEMSVIKQAKSIACWFVDHFSGDEKEQWEEFAYDRKDSFSFVNAIKEAGYDGWDEGHSGNSGAMAVSFAYTLLFQTELFPYMHGALCYLVGDEGYHDDRKDVHEAVEAFKAKHPEKA